MFPFAFDWRQPLENIESKLSAFVDEVIDRTTLLRHYHDAGYGTKKFPAQVIVRHFKEQAFGEIWGRVPPDIPAGTAWDPPIAGLAPR